MKGWIKWWLVMVGVMMVGGGWYVWSGKSITPSTSSRDEVQIDSSPMPTLTAQKEIKFAVMADIHNDWASLKKGLEMAQKRGDELVIIDGDMTLQGTEKELRAAKQTLDASGTKYYVVPGNHDLWQGVEIYKSVFGPAYIEAAVGEARIILINNASWKGLGKEQKAWIEQETEACKVVYCISVMHMPLNHNFSAHIMGEDNKTVAAEAASLVALLNTNNVKELIAGHLHYTTSYTLDNIHTTIVGAVSKDRNNQTPRFTEFHLAGKGLASEMVEID